MIKNEGTLASMMKVTLSSLQVQPGDRVAVTGIYRAAPLRTNPKMRNVNSVYRTHIDVVHYRKIDNKRLKTGGEHG